jgi:hypothetical protein
MAVEPLFNASRDVLLKRARIKTADDEQTLALIDQSMTEVRVGFYRAIGGTRSALIAGYTLVENPTTDQEILRAGAAYTEALWLTWLLAQRLPHLFMDNRASTGDMWNQEQLTRDTKAHTEYLNNLKAQIDEGLGMLMEPEPDNAGPVKASLLKNETAHDAFSPSYGLYPRGTDCTGVSYVS